MSVASYPATHLQAHLVGSLAANGTASTSGGTEQVSLIASYASFSRDLHLPHGFLGAPYGHSIGLSGTVVFLLLLGLGGKLTGWEQIVGVDVFWLLLAASEGRIALLISVVGDHRCKGLILRVEVVEVFFRCDVGGFATSSMIEVRVGFRFVIFWGFFNSLGVVVGDLTAGIGFFDGFDWTVVVYVV